MKLEQQVCSFEYAKKLKELGINQKGTFFFHVNEIPKSVWLQYKEHVWVNPTNKDGQTDVMLKDYMIRTFSVAELGILLGEFCASWQFNFEKEIKWISTLIGDPGVAGDGYIKTQTACDRFGLSEADARATLLIAFLEVGHFNIKEINKRDNR